MGMRRFLALIVTLSFIALFPSVTALADTSSSPQILTVEEAVQLALKNREDVRTVQLNWDAAWINSDLAWENANMSYSDSINQIYQTDYAIEAARTNYETKREAVEYSVYQKYYAVVNALDDLDAQKLSQQHAEDRLAITELRVQLGLDTKLALYQAQQQAASARTNSAVAEQSLDNAYVSLLDYIGVATDQRPELVRELTYQPLQIGDPETKINDIVRKSPSVWMADRSLLLQELTRDNSVGLLGDLENIKQEQAEIAVITSKDAMRQATRSLYYNVLKMQESYDTAVQGAKTADEALRVAKLLYEVGMGTKTDVTAAEIAAQSAHQAVNSLSYQHAMLVMAFERPWIAGSSM